MYFIGIITGIIFMQYLYKKETKPGCNCKDQYHDDDPEHLLEP